MSDHRDLAILEARKQRDHYRARLHDVARALGIEPGQADHGFLLLEAVEDLKRNRRRDGVHVHEVEPYCDVCGRAGADLRSSVEVCRDCLDVARSVASEELSAATRFVFWNASRTACHGAMTYTAGDYWIVWSEPPQNEGRRTYSREEAIAEAKRRALSEALPCVSPATTERGG